MAEVGVVSLGQAKDCQGSALISSLHLPMDILKKMMGMSSLHDGPDLFKM